MIYPSTVNRDRKVLAVAHGLSGFAAVTSILKLSPAVNMELLYWSFARTSTTIGRVIVAAVAIGAVVGVAVLCVSVLSLIQNVRKKRGQIGSNLVDSTPTQHRGDLVSSLSDISVSVASGAESLNSEEKIRLYKAWKLAIMNRKGVEDGFDVVEP